MLKLLYTRFFDTRNIEFLAIVLLCITAVGMPLSRFLMSFGTVGLAILFGISGHWDYKCANLKKSKFLWPLVFLFLLHIVWLFRANDISGAMNDINSKMPLIIFPLAIGSVRLTKKQIMFILHVFVVAVVISTLVSLLVYLGVYVPQKPVDNIRRISIFISHIRLGLMCLMSICIILYIWFRNRKKLQIWHKMVFCATIVWLFYFVILIQTVTSWVAFFVVMVVALIVYRKNLKRWQKASIGVLFAGTFLFGALFVYNVVSNFYKIRDTETELPKFTMQGNPYTHNLDSKVLENGHYVYRYLCVEELSNEWVKRSSTDLNSKNKSGFTNKHTLIRYLTSKGLPKDSCGFWQLSNAEIKSIEEGCACCIYNEKSSIYKRTYELIWEFDRYLKENDPNGKSVCMRIEFMKTGMHILKANLLFGVGTGDVKKSFAQAYEETNSPLKSEYRHMAHNQYLTFAISLGLIGFVLAMAFMIAPLFMRKSTNFLLVAFCTICFVSMFDEDTLIRQLGSRMFAMMYSLALLLPTYDEETASEQ